MYSEDDIHYAFEQTETLHEPDRRIDTFGTTKLEFLLLTEPMDKANQVRIRTGTLHAEQPQILRPDGFAEFKLDGFSDDQAGPLSDFLKHLATKFAVLKYGFNFQKTDVSEELVHDTLEAVKGRVLDAARAAGNPMAAVIQGVDDVWEICLMKFALEMVQKSSGINKFDFKRRGLL